MEENETKKDSIFSASNGNERRALTKIEIVSIRDLELWNETIERLQNHYENKLNNSSRVELLRVKVEGSLYGIFIMNQELFKRKLTPKMFDYLETIQMSKRKNGETINHEEYFAIVNKVFDEIGLTRIDFERIQKTLEETNRLRGLD